MGVVKLDEQTNDMVNWFGISFGSLVRPWSADDLDGFSGSADEVGSSGSSV